MEKPFNEHGPKCPEKFNIGDYALHGDVILERESGAPEDFAAWPIVKDHCIAYGEATGHTHKIFGKEGDFELRECPKTKVRHLHVIREVILKHQEHSPIVIPPGHFKTGIQKEYDPFEKISRQVID